MKILHTADWHIGQTLISQSRVYEHECFLNFLKDTIATEKPDVLIISGDIFDTSAPGSEALNLYFNFVSSLKESLSWSMQIVVIAGNHDSATRLNVLGILLKYINVKVIGKLPLLDSRPDYDSLMCPVEHNGQVEGVIAAVPFIRGADLPVEYVKARIPENSDQYVEGYRLIYQELLSHIRKKYGENVPVIATGHTFVTSALVSAASEYPIFCGNQQSVPQDIFDGYDYVALGHLHRPQALGADGRIVYAGSPFPLDFAEKNYRNRLMVIENDHNQKLTWREIRIPRFVRFVEVPESGSDTLDEVLKQLSELPDPGVIDSRQYPYLAIHVLIDKQPYNLIGTIDQKLVNTHYRRIKLSVDNAKKYDDDSNEFYHKDVREMTLDDAFRAFFKLRSPDHGEPTAEDMIVYHEIVDNCRSQMKEND
ncbi:MAG: exonuclease SbcCD subunit D [Succinivibrionaceae bacterium]